MTHVVHGLTTAASLWLSAAVGVACGGTLYFAASFGTAVMLVLLRFGPRFSELDDDEETEDDNDQDETERGGADIEAAAYRMDDRKLSERGANETSSLLPQPDSVSRQSTRNVASVRKRAHLGSVV